MASSSADKPVGNSIPIQQIMDAVQSIRHGDVHIVIQDGNVIQINKTEKVRLRLLSITNSFCSIWGQSG